MSDVSTINGKSIGNYDDYKNNIPEGGSASTFEQTAKIPLAGKYNVSDETMETRSVLLSELGGSGLPSTSGNEGKFLTVNSSEEAVWGAAPRAITSVNAGTGMTVGSGSGGIVTVGINTNDATNGDVLTYTDGNVGWVAPQGGGGGVSPIVTTEITPVMQDDTLKIIIPSNNAYYVVNDLQSSAEIVPPAIGANENYNVVLFINSEVGDDKQISIPDSEKNYGLHPMNTTSQNGWMYGMGLVQFIFLGKGYTMSGLPTEWS